MVGFIWTNWTLIALAVISGGMLLWPLIAAGRAGANLTPDGVVQLINRERAMVIDVREPDEFAAGHAGGARNVPLAQLQDKLPGLVKNKAAPLVLICATGVRSGRAAAAAKKWGYAGAQSLAGGLKSWREAGLPVESAAVAQKNQKE